MGQLFEKSKILHLEFLLILTLMNWARTSKTTRGQMDQFINEKRALEQVFKGLEVERMSDIFFRILSHAKKAKILIFQTLKFLWVWFSEDMMLSIVSVYAKLLTKEQGANIKYIVLFLSRVLSKSLAFKMELSSTKLQLGIQYKANLKGILEDIV